MDSVIIHDDRQEAARADRSTEVRSTLDQARILLAGVSKSLGSQIKSLENLAPVERDEKELKRIEELVRTTQKVLATVLAEESRLARETGIAEGGLAMDMEDARAEIRRRLARLAA